MKNASADRSFFTCAYNGCNDSFNRIGSPVILTSLAMETVQPLEATFVIYFFAFNCIIPFCLIFRSKITVINLRDLTAIPIGYFVLLYLLYDLQQRITIDKCFSRDSDNVVYTNTYINFWFLFYS